MRTIKVRGSANVKAKPDYVDILIKLETKDLDYENGMLKASQRVEELKGALDFAHLNSQDLKTTGFNVETDWDWENVGVGGRRCKFSGYEITQNLKFGMAFDQSKLTKILSAIVNSGADPEFRVQFSVHDPTAVKEELFAKASENARKIAEGLCRGMGKKLGEIIRIDYSWQELDIYHEIDWRFNGCVGSANAVPDINPEDINVSDSVTYVWELI